MALRWYVLRIRSNSENVAASELKREGFELFLPRIMATRANRTLANVPLFPGYLFIRYDRDDGHNPSMRRFPGILGWLKFNGETPVVPDEVIDELAIRVDNMSRNGGLWKGFRAGETVRVVSGLVESLAQVVEDVTSPHSKVNLVLEFMGRQVAAQTSWQNLERVQEDVVFEPTARSRRRTRGKGRWLRGYGPLAAVNA